MMELNFVKSQSLFSHSTLLAHENREKFISLFFCKSEEERENLRLMLQQDYVITYHLLIYFQIQIDF